MQGFYISNLLKSPLKRNRKCTYQEVLRSSINSTGEEKFIISAKWWQNWCDFVNFESLFESTNDIQQIKPINKIDSSFIENQSETPHYDIDRHLDVNDSTIYDRPGRITNFALIDPVSIGKYKYQLQDSLQELYDYIIINPASWNYLSSWYSYDYLI